jgi:TusA-related sulfurtransferase
MTVDIDTTETLDVKGLSCPMPVVKTKQAIDDLAPGDVLAVYATDSGSVSDIAGWAEGTAGVELLEQRETDGDDGRVYEHYVRRTE